MSLSYPNSAADETLAHARRTMLAAHRAPKLRTLAIHAALAIAFILLLARAQSADGISAWSIGLVYVGYDLFLMALAARQLAKLEPPPKTGSADTLRMAVIIAAHNEAEVLAATIGALTDAPDAPDEIIVADDGSTDGTPALLGGRFGLVPNASPDSPGGSRTTLVWLQLPHGGKARAMNAALLRTNAELIVTVDADTRLAPGSLAAMRRAFAADATLVAAGGVLTPECAPTPTGRALEWFQTHEYARNLMMRLAFSRLRCLLIISGAFAAFRRDAVVAVGGFEPSSLVEDYELVQRLHRHAADRGLDWRMQMVGDAVARTDAPATVESFLRQRRRWFAGFLKSHSDNLDMVADRRFGAFGTVMSPIKAADAAQPLFGLAAYGLLIIFALQGHWTLVWAALAVIAVKIAADIAFDIWSQRVMARLFQSETRRPSWPLAAALLTPFSFLLLRHAGAAWGWLAFLRGRLEWGRPQ